MYLERSEAVRRLKAALKKKTGKTWSVTGGRGTGWGWLRIQAPKVRRVAHGVNPRYNGFDQIDVCIRKTGKPPWIEFVSDDAEENRYTSDEDSRTLTEIFKPGHSYHYQGLSVRPEDWELYLERVEA
jgi:hypothetical protein